MKKSKVYSLRSKVFPGRRSAASGFTLIELMMVVLVILLLSGLLFKLGSIIKDRTERAQALADIENLSNAIEAYYGVYGQYPPTTDMKYEYPDSSLWSDPMNNTEVGFETNGFFTSKFKWGLYSYLYERGNEDPRQSDERDAVVQRWQHLLQDVGTSGGPQGYELPDGLVGGPQPYSNQVKNIKDPWGAEYQYESKPPHLSYKLWSSNLD